MTARSEEIGRLQHLIERRRRAAGMTRAELARCSGVDESQVSRICRGEFRTFGGSVVRICKALGLEAFPDPGCVSPVGDGRALLNAALARAWDGTPEGAVRLAAVLDAVAVLGGR